MRAQALSQQAGRHGRRPSREGTEGPDGCSSAMSPRPQEAKKNRWDNAVCDGFGYRYM